jgi:hypothetical protein
MSDTLLSKGEVPCGANKTYRREFHLFRNPSDGAIGRNDFVYDITQLNADEEHELGEFLRKEVKTNIVSRETVAKLMQSMLILTKPTLKTPDLAIAKTEADALTSAALAQFHCVVIQPPVVVQFLYTRFIESVNVKEAQVCQKIDSNTP